MVTKDNVADKLVEIDKKIEILMRLKDKNPGGFDMLIEDAKERRRKLLNTKAND